MKLAENLYVYEWKNYFENNCNSFFVDGTKKVLIDPGHRHLFQHVRRGLERIGISPEQIDAVLVTHGHPDHLETVGSFGPSTRCFMFTSRSVPPARALAPGCWRAWAAALRSDGRS